MRRSERDKSPPAYGNGKTSPVRLRHLRTIVYIHGMNQTISVSKLRDRLSEVIHAVSVGGHTVQVTSHGRVVAQISPAITKSKGGADNA